MAGDRKRCLAFIAAGGAAIAVYYAVPWKAVHAVLFVGIGAAAAAVIAARAGSRRTPAGRAWTAVAVGIGLFCAGDLIWYVYDLILHRDAPATSVADVMYLAGYPFLTAGVLLLVRARTSGRGRDGLLDGLIFGVGTTALAWVLIIDGAVTDPTLSVPARVTLAAYPLMDVVILIALVRLALTESRAIPSYWLMVAGLALMFTADTAFALVPALSTSADAQPLDWLWMFSYVLVASSALDPSMRTLSEPSDAPTAHFGNILTAMLGASLLAAPVALAVARPASVADRVVLLALCGVSVGLVLVRLRTLVRDRDRDMAERVRAHDELAHSALHDVLTGLPNRRLFLDRLELALAELRRADDTVAVLFLDLDRFKLINDSAGHQLGDDLLVQVSRRIEQCLRPGDTVARFGGDEFIVLCARVANADAALVIADRLMEAIGSPMRLGPHVITISVSIGICVAADGSDNRALDLLRDADVAMYQAKANGRDRAELFQETMRGLTPTRLEAEGTFNRTP